MAPSCVVQLTLEERDGIQRDLGRLESWGCASLVELSEAKSKVLHLGQSNSKHKHRLGREWIESSPEEKDLEVVVDEKLDLTWQFAPAAQKDKGVMACTKKLGKPDVLESLPAHGSEGTTRCSLRSIPTQIIV
ncbi:hypothetical protein TURU_001646 [Turdus rufiventris]|nr:hypothetical protein TURU_001646 [Turdus rufiventris]